MGKFVLLNARLFQAGADLTTVNNKVELSAEVEEKEATAFAPSGDVYKEVLGGLRSASLQASGQWEADDVVLGKIDDTAWAGLGAITPMTVCPATAAVGSLAWFSGFLRTNYQLGDAVGSVAPWSSNGSGTWPLVRGAVAHDPGTARTATGNGTVIQIAAASPGVPAGKQLYAAVHVLSVAGTTPSLTVAIQTDDTAGFASPTTAITFNAATAKGGQILRAAGPITDNYVRASWTISGTSPSFLFLVSVGVA
ncbi:hypothetical protein ACTOB_001393 [Actinoplanes oblitus]|uniref:Uncharacterized protein n=1 Tax=Actinoplanes oblitus TaxID=3040509 RepID=A0ABY8WIY3_9ACTN|nr:hypothetical protein [Actinoplanes oblitus]WIM97839.1 hypothetical protein ACTOB_001393 [Actinoplanes oblitus]